MSDVLCLASGWLALKMNAGLVRGIAENAGHGLAAMTLTLVTKRVIVYQIGQFVPVRCSVG